MNSSVLMVNVDCILVLAQVLHASCSGCSVRANTWSPALNFHPDGCGHPPLMPTAQMKSPRKVSHHSLNVFKDVLHSASFHRKHLA